MWKTQEVTMNILIIGGRGFLGTKIVEKLSNQYSLTVTTRRRKNVQTSKGVSFAYWDAENKDALIPLLEKSDAVINLAGESIATHRWTQRQKERIRRSRINTTHVLAAALAEAQPKPQILLNASAVGYYGNVPEGDVTENSPRGTGFLADVCEQWEMEAEHAMTFGVRVVLLRTGIVLDRKNGIFPKLLMPARFFAGSVFGEGNQWFPWIHIDDEVRAIEFLLTTSISGAVNLTAPVPVRFRDFCKELTTHIHRPLCWKVPSFIPRMLLGEMGVELLLSGQKALPQKLLTAGFQFRYPTIEQALQNLLNEEERDSEV